MVHSTGGMTPLRVEQMLKSLKTSQTYTPMPSEEKQLALPPSRRRRVLCIPYRVARARPPAQAASRESSLVRPSPSPAPSSS